MLAPRSVAIVQKPEDGSSWWRFTGPYRYLQDHGHPLSMTWADSGNWHDLHIPKGTELIVLPSSYSVVPGHETSFALWMTTQRREYGRKFVYDCDDDVVTQAWTYWMLDADMAPRGGPMSEFKGLEEYRKTRCWLMQMCDAITVENELLEQTVGSVIDRPIYVLRNSIDAYRFRMKVEAAPPPHRMPDEVVVGWAGGQRPESDLETMLRAWKRIARNYPNVTFQLAGWMPQSVLRGQSIPIDRLVYIPWTTTAEYPLAMRVDIACCPVHERRFDQHRSPIKAFEFALAGAAVIGSDHPYSAILGPWGKLGYRTGIVARTSDEWYEAIASYLESPDARRIHALKLRERVIKEHTLRTGANQWSRAYRAIAGRTDANAIKLRDEAALRRNTRLQTGTQAVRA